jgi:hypothetical protein
MFAKYKTCCFCNSKKLKKDKIQRIKYNFYIEAIMSHFNLKKNKISQMKVYTCNNCHLKQNSPWFDKEHAVKIYSNAYGQHNRGWSNLIDYKNKGILPDHGNLFYLLIKNLKIKKYAEFNSPFMGILLNFLNKEIKNKKTRKFFIDQNIKYLSSRQLAGFSLKQKKKSNISSKKLFNSLIKFKNKNFSKKRVKKYLFSDNYDMCWGINDNYKSVNSKSLATELFDLKIKSLHSNLKDIKLDLFGIFHTLDHTFEPKKILDNALDVSKNVIVYCHVSPELNKQHLFTFTKDFLKYLKKKNIFTIDLTNKIYKHYNSPELYFLCSKKKIKKFKFY